MADEYATTVIRFVERGVYIPAPADVLSLLQEIMLRLDRLGTRESLNGQRIARAQHAYAALLEIVYRHFLDMGQR
jgi:hypothetical protein